MATKGKTAGRLAGVRAAARAVGRSPAHVSLVLRGIRKSKRLTEALAKAGVRLQA